MYTLGIQMEPNYPQIFHPRIWLNLGPSGALLSLAMPYNGFKSLFWFPPETGQWLFSGQNSNSEARQDPCGLGRSQKALQTPVEQSSTGIWGDGVGGKIQHHDPCWSRMLESRRWGKIPHSEPCWGCVQTSESAREWLRKVWRLGDDNKISRFNYSWIVFNTRGFQELW